jgi:hypothetical protein
MAMQMTHSGAASSVSGVNALLGILPNGGALTNIIDLFSDGNSNTLVLQSFLSTAFILQAGDEIRIETVNLNTGGHWQFTGSASIVEF